jgi:hypothetical protein
VITTRLPTTIEDYFIHVRDAINHGKNVALITLDIKHPAAQPQLLTRLQNAVHTYLNNQGIPVFVIYSVGSYGDASAFTSIHLNLEGNEGIMIDGENAPFDVVNLLHFGQGSPFLNAPRVGFGNGSAGVNSGFAPNVLPSIDQASWYRAGGNGGFWDRARFINGGDGYGLAIPYAFPISVAGPPDIGRLAHALIDNGVDGLIPDWDVPIQEFADITASEINSLWHYINDYDPNLYVANVLDQPFYVPPEGYAIRVHTTSDVGAADCDIFDPDAELADCGDGDGTNARITFTLAGECGSSTVTVDGGHAPLDPVGFLHRFHRAEDTYITLPSKNLGRLTSLTLSSDSTDLLALGQVYISSVRWNLDFGDQHMFDMGGRARKIKSSRSQQVAIPNWGSPCDTVPPHASPQPTPSTNVNGWNNTSITVHWNWADNDGGSGLRLVACRGTDTPASIEGVYPVQSTCQDVDGNDATAAYSVHIDKTPPSVTCAAPDGMWHANDVSLACGGSDLLSGLANPADSSFLLTTSVPAGTETADAPTSTHTFADRADNSVTAGPVGGNRVDKKAPVIGIAQPAAAEYTHADTLVLNYTVTDGGSGVAGVSPVMNGSPTVAGNPLASGQAIQLLTSLPLGPNTFTIDSIDNVGNKSRSSITFNIIVTAASILEDLTQLEGKGLLQRGDSLAAKLNAAAASRARGNCGAAANQYAAFINEVRAQTGKTITPIASALLIGDAQYLIAHCQ